MVEHLDDPAEITGGKVWVHRVWRIALHKGVLAHGPGHATGIGFYVRILEGALAGSPRNARQSGESGATRMCHDQFKRWGGFAGAPLIHDGSRPFCGGS